MEQFLRKLKLIQNFNVGIPLDKVDFIFLFRKHVDYNKDAIFPAFTEIFSKSKNKYVGEIDHRGFKFRKRKRLFSANKNSSIVKGVFKQKDNRLFVETEIKGFTVMKMTIYIWIVLFCLYFVGFKLAVKSNEPLYSIILALSLQALLLFGIPYLVAKSRIKRMQIEFEQDIYDWIVNW